MAESGICQAEEAENHILGKEQKLNTFFSRKVSLKQANSSREKTMQAYPIAFL